MQRPGVVWAYSILLVIAIIVSCISTLTIFLNPKLLAISGSMYLLIINLLLIIPYIIFVYKFFMLKRNSINWLYVVFGISIIIDLVSQSYIWAVIVLIVGWAVYDYIKNKKDKEGNFVFN